MAGRSPKAGHPNQFVSNGTDSPKNTKLLFTEETFDSATNSNNKQIQR